MYGNDTLVFDKLYVTPSGEKFMVDKLKFFLSDIGFFKADNSESKPVAEAFKQGIFLIDFNNPGTYGNGKSTSYKIDFKLAPGDYKSLRFNIGIPREYNRADPTLAPATLQSMQPGMYWSWNSGYIFLLAEGKGPDVAGNTFHFGIGEEKRSMPFSFGDIFSPIPVTVVEQGKTTRVQIYFDFQKLLLNADGTYYSLSEISNTSVHGGYLADVLSANASNTMELVSSSILP